MPRGIFYNHVTPIGLSLCIVYVVFAPNRFDVPYALDLAGWDIYPSSILLLFAMSLLLCLARRAISGPPVSQPTADARIDGDRLSRSAAFALRNSLGILFFAWLSMMTLSTLIGVFIHGMSWKGIAALFSIALWVTPLWIVPRLGLTRRSYEKTFAVFIACAVLGAFITILEVCFTSVISNYLYSEPNHLLRAVLPLGVSTVLGNYYIMALPLGIALAVQGGKQRRVVGGAVSLLMLVGCFSTLSRSCINVAVFIALLSLVWFPIPIRSKISAMVAMILVIFVSLVGFSAINPRTNRVGRTYDASIEWRLRGMTAAIKMIADHPLIGTGVESYFTRRISNRSVGLLGKEVPEDVIVYRYRVAPREPHNLFLLVGAESGLPGLGLFLCFLGVLGHRLYRSHSRQSTDRDRLLAKAIFVGYIGIVVQGLSGTELVSYHRIAILFWMYCGLGLGLGTRKGGTLSPPEAIETAK